MPRVILLLLLTLTFTTRATTTQPTTAPSKLSAAQLADAEKLAGEFADRLTRSRYMERGEAKDVKIPGWEKFATKRYHYSVKDKDGTEKFADVVMLNPSAQQIARWIVSAELEAHGKYDTDAGRAVFKHILGQSGGQFPVTGVVYEDILPEDGKFEIYCFRNGVTVEVEGIPHRGTEPLTPEQMEIAVSGKLKRSFTYARIQSTTPKQWLDAFGGPGEILKDGKATLKWPDVIREAYQRAWGEDRNELMVAWVRANEK